MSPIHALCWALLIRFVGWNVDETKKSWRELKEGRQ